VHRLGELAQHELALGAGRGFLLQPGDQAIGILGQLAGAARRRVRPSAVAKRA